MSISKKYTDYGDNLSSETTIRGEIDIDTLLQTYAYIHIHFYALYCASVQNSFLSSRPKIVVSYRKKREKTRFQKEGKQIRRVVSELHCPLFENVF